MQQILHSTITKSVELIKKSHFDEAEVLLKQQLLKHPSQYQALNLLGQIALHKKDYALAIMYLEKSLKLNSKDHLMNYFLGLAYQYSGLEEKAIECYLRTKKLQPEYKNTYEPLALLLAKQHRYFEAYELFKIALKHSPENLIIINNLIFVSKRLGLYKDTIYYCKRKLAIDPKDGGTLESLIFHSHKDPSLNLKDFNDLAEEYYSKFLKREHLVNSFGEQLNKDKKTLRIGFVSFDLFEHPVSTFLLALIERLDREAFEVYLYYTNTKYDNVTDLFKAQTNNFTDLSELDDLSAAKKIQEDAIDILFDLSGFTKGNRLGVFAHKPAPVQVTYIGYFGTLAMPEMDYIFADDNVIKKNEQEFFTEKVYSLGSCFTHAELTKVKQISQSPAFEKNGYLCFGSMNRFHKVSEKNIAIWSRILHQVPGSKFLFNCSMFKKESNIEFVQKLFGKYKISQDRLIFRSDLPREDFLKTYADFDISLDPFPYGGGTTSLESLMNGVPVVTIYGDRWVSRMSSTKLITIDCKELIADNEEEYIDIAVTLANDKERIKAYRISLPAKINESELNIEKFMKKFENALKTIWQKECDKS